MAVGDLKEAPLAQMRADGWEVIASHESYERNLAADSVPRLTREPVKRRRCVVYQWDLGSCAGVHDTGNGANLFQHGAEEGIAPDEVLIAEQRSLKGQQLFTTDTKVSIPQMLKGLEQQAAAGQQRHRDGRLDDDK